MEKGLKGNRDGKHKGKAGLERNELTRFMCSDLYSLDKAGVRDVQTEFLILD